MTQTDPLTRWGFDDFVSRSREKGYLYDPPCLDGISGSHAVQDGRTVINFAGINLLGLQEERSIMDTFCHSARRLGIVTGGSRATQGVNRVHATVEDRVSGICRTESSVTFATGLLANVGFLHTMTNRFGFDTDGCAIDNRDVVCVLDHDCHWSLWKGVSHLDFGKNLFIFRHNDVGHLRQILESLSGKRVLVVFESVYSADGSIAPIGEILDACESHGALSYVDNANGFLVYGSPECPLSDTFRDLPRATFQMLSFSKGVGLEGGAVCGPREAIETVLATSGTSLFTAAIQPPTAATIVAILDYVSANPDYLASYLDRAEELRHRLLAQGLRLYDEPSYILSVIVGDDDVAERVRARLLERGYLVPIFRYPAVKRGAAAMRLIMNARHTDADIDGLVGELTSARDDFGF